MALSGKYGKLSIPNIADDEPVFILRAQDALAETTIEIYKLLAGSHDLDIADSLEMEIGAFHHWSGTKKLPD